MSSPSELTSADALAAELRGKARDCFNEQTDGYGDVGGRTPNYGFGKEFRILAEVPSGPGLVTVVVRSRGAFTAIQVFRLGPGRLVPCTSLTRIGDQILPIVAFAIGASLDLAAEEKRQRRARPKPVITAGRPSEHSPPWPTPDQPPARGPVDDDPLPDWAGGGAPQKQGETP